MREERELTLRALTTGVLLGAALAPYNLYSGLRIGWSFNMSVIALAFWRLLGRFANGFALAAAAGLIAGESIVGVAASFWDMAR